MEPLSLVCLLHLAGKLNVLLIANTKGLGLYSGSFHRLILGRKAEKRTLKHYLQLNSRKQYVF